MLREPSMLLMGSQTVFQPEKIYLVLSFESSTFTYVLKPNSEASIKSQLFPPLDAGTHSGIFWLHEIVLKQTR